MKKWLVWVLLCSLLVFSASAEETFFSGADQLLDSVQLDRDMLTLRTSYESQDFEMQIRKDGDLYDLALNLAGDQTHLQFLKDELYIQSQGTTVRVRYEDLKALKPQNLDPGALAGIAELTFRKFISPHVQVSLTDGVQVHYEASAQELSRDFAEWVDELLEKEEYSAFLSQFLATIGRASGQTMPGLEEIRQLWAGEKESILNTKAEGRVLFDLNTDSSFSEITVTGEIGPSNDLYRMEWSGQRSEGKIQVKGKLSERITRGETSRDYDINIDANAEKGFWHLNIDYPSRPFSLTAEGSSRDGMGRFSATAMRLRGSRPTLQIDGTYAASDKGLTAQMTVVERMGTPVTVSAVFLENLVDISARTALGTTPFALKVHTEGGTVDYAYFETFNSGDVYQAMYDGTQAILSVPDVRVTVTWAEESEHAFVFTLHPELNNGAPGGDAYIRLEDEGTEGNFTIRGKLIDYEGTEVFLAELKCEPTEGITEKLSEAENVLTLTPQQILQLMQ